MNTEFIEMEIFCYITNVFTNTFDQFNVPLLKNSVHLLKK